LIVSGHASPRRRARTARHAACKAYAHPRGLQPASRAPGCAGGGRRAGGFDRPHRTESAPHCVRQLFFTPHPPQGGFERPSHIMQPVIRNRRSPQSRPTGRTRRLRITRTMCQWPLPRPAVAVRCGAARHVVDPHPAGPRRAAAARCAGLRGALRRPGCPPEEKEKTKTKSKSAFVRDCCARLPPSA